MSTPIEHTDRIPTVTFFCNKGEGWDDEERELRCKISSFRCNEIACGASKGLTCGVLALFCCGLPLHVTHVITREQLAAFSLSFIGGCACITGVPILCADFPEDDQDYACMVYPERNITDMVHCGFSGEKTSAVIDYPKKPLRAPAPHEEEDPEDQIEQPILKPTPRWSKAKVHPEQEAV